jgi:hypothetical protein
MGGDLTESQRILAQGQESASVTDSRERVLEVKRLSRREVMRCMRQWGQASNVEQWLSLALLTASVRSVDGRPVPMPQNVEQVEAISELLGDEGTQAVADWYQKQAAPDLGEERAAAKN